MSRKLKKCTAIVTGGSKGYGAGIARQLKSAGATVFITGRDEKALMITAKQLGVHAIQADVSRSADWDRLFETVKNETGRLDILVNNAGAGGDIVEVAAQKDEAIAACIATNLTGAMMGCRRAAVMMKNQKSGTIINIASACAIYAWPGWAVYSAAKGGIMQFSRCLYAELRGHGVRVTAIIPSWGATGFAKAAHIEGPGMDAKVRKACIQPREIGDLVVYLATLPAHLAIPDVTLLPLVQEIIPM